MPITPFIGVRISWLIVARKAVRARGLLGRLPRPAKFHLALFHGRDVAFDPDRHGVASVRIEDRRQAGFHPDGRAILSAVQDQRPHGDFAPVCIDQAADGFGVGFVAVQQRARGLSDRLGKAVAGDPGEGFVHPDDASVGTGDDDAVVGVFRHQRQLARVLFLFPKFGLRCLQLHLLRHQRLIEGDLPRPGAPGIADKAAGHDHQDDHPDNIEGPFERPPVRGADDQDAVQGDKSEGRGVDHDADDGGTGMVAQRQPGVDDGGGQERADEKISLAPGGLIQGDSRRADDGGGLKKRRERRQTPRRPTDGWSRAAPEDRAQHGAIGEFAEERHRERRKADARPRDHGQRRRADQNQHHAQGKVADAAAAIAQEKAIAAIAQVFRRLRPRKDRVVRCHALTVACAVLPRQRPV